MKKSSTSNKSLTDWTRLDSMTDDDIALLRAYMEASKSARQ